MTKRKLLLIILDGQPYKNARRLNGNLEGWVAAGMARVWKMRSVLPSTSASCYASIHTGVTPQVHGVVSNETLFRVQQPDIFSAVRAAGGKSAAVTHSFWSVFFNRAPFDAVRDIEYDETDSNINHGRFHTMTGYGDDNQMTPSDLDLFATLTKIIETNSVDYGLLHTCTLDSMGHRFGHDCVEMDKACFVLDGLLAEFIPRWLNNGYEVMVSADHGQTKRGHHGGRGEKQQSVACYWFGDGEGPDESSVLDQLQLAPTILSRMGIAIPETMQADVFIN